MGLECVFRRHTTSESIRVQNGFSENKSFRLKGRGHEEFERLTCELCTQ